MDCFPCLAMIGQRKKDKGKEVAAAADNPSSTNTGNEGSTDSTGMSSGSRHSTDLRFTFSELANITKNFDSSVLLGQGGFGSVYQGTLDSGKVVAVKRLDENSLQGNKEFDAEVYMLCKIDNPNLVKMVGYCSEGEQRLVVYEYMPLGSLDDYLHNRKQGKQPLDWATRINIIVRVAKGLQYLHSRTPPIIYRDMKPSNILLDHGFVAKLSDFGLARDGPVGDKTHVTTRIMGTLGYCAPEYAMTGKLTLKSDIYTFGVVLLEIVTGREAYDNTRTSREQNLVEWATPLLMDKKNHELLLVDQVLKRQYKTKDLSKVLEIARVCVQEDPIMRPKIGEIVVDMENLGNEISASSASTSQGPSSSSVHGMPSQAPINFR